MTNDQDQEKSKSQLNEEILKDYDRYFTADDLKLLFEICNKARQQQYEKDCILIGKMQKEEREFGAEAERENILNKIKDMQLNDAVADWYKEEPKEDMWIKCCKRILNNLRNPKTKEGE